MGIKIKKAQLAVFVIIALIIVGSFILFLYFSKEPGFDITGAENPQPYIESCLKADFEELNKEMIDNNGFAYENMTVYMKYKGEKIPYLCKASEFYSLCMPQEPLLIETAREQIKEHLEPEIEECFDSLKQKYERAGYDVETGELELNISFKESSIEADIHKRFAIEKEEDKRTFSMFKSSINSPLFPLLTLAQTIVNYESTYCEFNEVNWMMTDSDILIKRFRAGDQTKIYTLTYIDTGDELNFAVKTCIMPAGI